MTVLSKAEKPTQFLGALSLVAGIARLLREKPVGRDAIEQVFALIAEVVPFDGATLYLYNRKKNTLEEVVSQGGTVNVLQFLHFGVGAGLAGWAAQQKKPILIPGRDPAQDNVRLHHDSVLILPLVVTDALIGVLSFRHHDQSAFAGEQQKVLEVVADQVAVSLERIIYARELERQNKSLEQAHEELRSAQSRLVAQEKLNAVVELAASVNHEINNPLTVIVGNARMIELETAAMPENAAARVRAIIEAANRISLVTHKLTKIDRLVTQTYVPDTTPTMLDLDQSAGEE